MDLPLPPWTTEWLGPVSGTRRVEGERCRASLEVGDRYQRVSCLVPNARHLSDDDLQSSTCEAYELLRDLLDAHEPIRIWNGLPGILDAASLRRDRYMVFNAGRHDAFDSWFGGQGPEAFAAAMPAATGVGHVSDNLVVHTLADTRPGIAIENPRQCPAFRYSERYGPRPPCFSRGRLVDGPQGSDGQRLLISGTASVVGEDSAHDGDLEAQLAETFVNIGALIEAAGGAGLDQLLDVRAYYTPDVDVQMLDSLLRSQLSERDVLVELCPVLLCRTDLMIEIEAVARI